VLKGVQTLLAKERRFLRKAILFSLRGSRPKVEKKTTIPSDPKDKELHCALDIRAQRILLDGVKDHLIPNIGEKQTTHEMWTHLKGLFEAKHASRIMALKERLQHTKMTKGEGIITYLTKVKQLLDELLAAGVKLSSTEIV
jgi:hypothetical protein